MPDPHKSLEEVLADMRELSLNSSPDKNREEKQIAQDFASLTIPAGKKTESRETAEAFLEQAEDTDAIDLVAGKVYQDCVSPHETF